MVAIDVILNERRVLSGSTVSGKTIVKPGLRGLSGKLSLKLICRETARYHDESFTVETPVRTTIKNISVPSGKPKSYTFSFTIPEDYPPSYKGSMVTVDWFIEADLKRILLPDIKCQATFEVYNKVYSSGSKEVSTKPGSKIAMLLSVPECSAKAGELVEASLMVGEGSVPNYITAQIVVKETVSCKRFKGKVERRTKPLKVVEKNSFTPGIRLPLYLEIPRQASSFNGWISKVETMLRITCYFDEEEIMLEAPLRVGGETEGESFPADYESHTKLKNAVLEVLSDGVPRDVAGIRVDLYLKYRLVPSYPNLQAILDGLVAQGLIRVESKGKSRKYSISRKV